MIRLTVLGSGTGWPRADRAAPGYLVEGRLARLLVDPGPGSLHQLARAGGDARALDAVLVSHRHLDHASELGPMLFALRNPAYRRSRPLLLAGGPGLRAHYRRLRALHGTWVDPAGYRLRIVEGSRWRAEIGDLAVQAGPVPHIPGAVGFRIMSRDGAALAYSGDTEEGPGLVDLARGADLLLTECSAPDRAPIPKHCTPSMVGRMAKAAGVGRVLLTHFYPGVDPRQAIATVRRIARAPVSAAQDGLVVTVQARDRSTPGVSGS